MARGLDKEAGGSSPPKRNPFRQEIRSKEEQEEARVREAAKLSQREQEILQKRKEEILSSPLAGLYYVENFSEAADLLALAEPNERDWEYIGDTIYGENVFPVNAKTIEESEAWVGKNTDLTWQAFRKELEGWISDVDFSRITAAEEHALAHGAYLLRFLLSLEVKKSPVPVDSLFKKYAQVETELSHFAIGAKALEILKDETAPWTLAGETRAKIEELFLDHLFSWIGK